VEKRRDGQGAAFFRQHRSASVNIQEADTGVRGRAIAVRHAAGNPHATLRRDHPKAARDLAGHPPRSASTKCPCGVDELVIRSLCHGYLRAG
jgi:hypothetical protein